MTQDVTYMTTNLSAWNTNRRGEIELDALARAYIGNREITDRDRLAFALRELRRAGYEVDARPVDLTKATMISSLGDSEFQAFGVPKPSRRYQRLSEIGARTELLSDEIQLENLLGQLYDEEKLYDVATSDSLQEPYVFDFKGDCAYVEGVFQAVGFATRLRVSVPDNGSETYNVIEVAPPPMVID